MGNPKYRQGFRFTLHENSVDLPLKWSRPRKIFVNSMSDLFHENMPNDFLKACFDTMETADWHVYQILTKRPHRMHAFIRDYGNVPDHIWLGTSVELAMYKGRIDILKQIPAKTRFISFEPLLGAIGEIDLRGISWAIVGGESGPVHRPIDRKWVVEIRKQCKRQGVAFFFKQWGGRTAKAGGRILDGREWNEYPIDLDSSFQLPIAL